MGAAPGDAVARAMQSVSPILIAALRAGKTIRVLPHTSGPGGELGASRRRLFQPRGELLYVGHDARVGREAEVRIAVVRDDGDTEAHRRVQRRKRPDLAQLGPAWAKRERGPRRTRAVAVGAGLGM